MTKTALFIRTHAALQVLGITYNKHADNIDRIEKALARYRKYMQQIVEAGLVDEYIDFCDKFEEDRL